ncbi:hypothetical protein [Methylobacterium sp. CM6246]
MPTILCQLKAVLRFMSTPDADPNIRACQAALLQAIEALERHVLASGEASR